MSEWTGTNVIVTGASRGIGAATAKAFGKVGANVTLLARTVEAMQPLVNELSRGPATATAIACDVADFDQVQAAVSDCVSRGGSVDVLINNAGLIDPIARLADADPAAWATVVDVNYKGVFHGMRAAIPHMLDQGHGTIINMSSGAATSALEGWSHYCSSKAAVQMLTRCAHKEYGDQGVRVIGLSPGTVATPMMEQIRDSGVNPVSRLDWSTHIPAEWVAQAILYLTTREADDYLGEDFSLKVNEGRKRVGLPPI